MPQINMPRVYATDVDGVRALWSPLPGPLRAGLILRVGSADETLITSGITHLLEHLALFGLAQPDDHANGQVNQTITMFHSTGDEQQVTGFLNSLTQQLTAPVVHRLAEERQVLRAEYATRPPTVGDSLLLWRYGARSYGVRTFGGFGLDRVDGDLLRAWSHRHATRQNAVLWLTGPPPAGLQLTLSDGLETPTPDLWASILPRFPAHFAGPDDSIALSAVLPRTLASQALAHILEVRLFDELRTRRAVAYSPHATYTPVTADAGHLTMFSDLAAGRQSDGVRPFLAMLHDLAGHGSGSPAHGTEVDRWRTGVLRGLSEPEAGLDHLLRQAAELTLGSPVREVETWCAHVAAVQADDVTAAADAALATALTRVPAHVRVTREAWTPAPATLLEPLPGPGLAPIGGANPGQRLIVTDAGLSRREGEAAHATVTVDHAVAVQAWPDGRRVVIGAEGNQVEIEPTLWEHGREAVATIDRLWPHLIVPMPGRRPGEIPAPPPPGARPPQQTPRVDTPVQTTRPGRAWLRYIVITGPLWGLACYLLALAVAGFTMAAQESTAQDVALDVVIGAAFTAAAVWLARLLLRLRPRIGSRPFH